MLCYVCKILRIKSAACHDRKVTLWVVLIKHYNHWISHYAWCTCIYGACPSSQSARVHEVSYLVDMKPWFLSIQKFLSHKVPSEIFPPVSYLAMIKKWPYIYSSKLLTVHRGVHRGDCSTARSCPIIGWPLIGADSQLPKIFLLRLRTYI